MTTPAPVPAQQPGESTYAYRNRVNLARYGKSTYQLRVDRARARGLTTSEARGHAPAAGQTEYQRRRQRSIEQTGQTPSQIWRARQIQWLQQNGYTPQTTGWSWSRLIVAAPRIRYLNAAGSPGNDVSPGFLFDGMQQAGSEWTWEHFNEKYWSTKEWLEQNDNTRGRFHWFQDREEAMPVAWWYYH
jgi:hypothetical protein